MADDLDIAIQETLTILTRAKTFRQGIKQLFALAGRLDLDAATTAYLRQIDWAADAEALREQLAVALSTIVLREECAVDVYLDGLNASRTRQMVASVDESDVELASPALASAYDEVQCASLWDYTICLGYIGLALREALKPLSPAGVRFQLKIGFVGGDWFGFGSVTDGRFEPHLDEETRRIYFKPTKPTRAVAAPKRSPESLSLDTPCETFLAAVVTAPRTSQMDGDAIEDVFRILPKLSEVDLNQLLPEVDGMDFSDLQASEQITIHAELSEAYRRTGNRDRALDHFREAERLFLERENDPYGLVELCESDVYCAGRALGVRSKVSFGEPSPLDALFDIRDDPDTPIARRAAAAEEWLDTQLATLKPEDRTTAAMNVARLQRAVGAGDLGKWTKLIDLRHLQPHDALALWELGESASARKLYRDEVETSLAQLSSVVCGDFHHPAIAIRGAILPLESSPPAEELAWAVGELTDSIRRTALEHSWSSMAAACEFAKVYLAAGDGTGANEMLDFAIACAPDARGAEFASMHEKLAILLARVGRVKEALSAVKRMPLKQRAVGEIAVLCVSSQMEQVRERFRTAKSDRERFVIAMTVLKHGR